MTTKYPKDWTDQDKRRFRVYGVSPDDFRKMDLGYCPLCNRKWSNTVRPCIDHNHTTGYVRGVLCGYCNRYVLGRLSDVGLARRIVDYLDAAEKKQQIKVPPRKRKRKKRKRK